jgi:hypothetical protein
MRIPMVGNEADEETTHSTVTWNPDPEETTTEVTTETTTTSSDNCSCIPWWPCGELLKGFLAVESL